MVIRFNSRAADYIREKEMARVPTMRDLKDGEAVELSFKLSSLVEIERWVLSWGGDARVLKPRELAESVRQAAEKILQSS